MVDKPPRPILHLKFPPAEPAEAEAARPKPAAAPVRVTPIAPGRKTLTVREFTPAPSNRPQRAPRPPRFDPPPAPPKPSFEWKCKPCGKGLNIPPDAADDDAVRCPNCNARLGLARDFRSDPPNLAKVRARLVAKG